MGLLTDDYTEFNADILFEKNFAGAGVLDLEAAFYKFNGDFEPTDAAWYGVASYLLPNDIGRRKDPAVDPRAAGHSRRRR